MDHDALPVLPAQLPFDVAICEWIMRFLQLLCENHNGELQTFVRDQTANNGAVMGNHNLVGEILLLQNLFSR